jgi:thiol:disulfide interchange protein DsbC
VKNCFVKLSILGLLSFNVAASEQIITDAVAVLSEKIQQKFNITEIAPSEIPGISQVALDTKIVYITNDGKYAIVGNILDISADPHQWNLTERLSNKMRSNLLNEVKQQQPIVYKATAPKIGEVVVFTDVDCIYSKKMHKQIHEYTKLGIEVIFLAFPRNENSSTFDKTQSIWCSADPLESLDLVAAKGRRIESKSCENPIKEHIRLGQRLGVTGTPAIFLSNGTFLAGYMEPATLASLLKKS